MKKRIARSKLSGILGIAVILVLTHVVSYVGATQVETIQIRPLALELFIFSLDEEERVMGSLFISGGSDNDIDFWITNPQGTTIVNLGRVSQGATFEFTAQQSGAYTFHFDNQVSWASSKTVILAFNVEKPLLKNPNVRIFLLGAFIIGIAINALFVVRTRKEHYQKEKADKNS